MKEKFLSRSDSLSKAALVLIILLGLFFRTIYISHNPIGHYGIPSLTTALDIVEGKNYPLLGPGLGEFKAQHGPAAYYILSLPIFVNRSPISIFLFIALLNVISIYVVYRTGKDYFSKNAGLVAALLHTINPNLIARQDVSEKSLTMIFVSLAYYCIFAILLKKNSRFYWLVFPALFTLGIQLHFQLVLTLFLAFILYLLFKPVVHKTYLILGIGIGALFLSPQIWHDFTSDYSQFLSYYSAGMAFISENINTLEGMGNRKASVFDNCMMVFGVLFLYYLMAMLYSSVRIIRKKQSSGKLLNDENKKILSLLAFSVISILLFSKYQNQDFNRYYTAYTPMTIFIGIAFNGILFTSLRNKRLPLRILLESARVSVVFSFVGMLLLYTVKSYALSLVLVRPTPNTISDKFVRYMCMDNYIENCEESLGLLPEYFSRTTYNYRRKQFSLFYDEFGINRETLLENVHGMGYFWMFGDDGYLFRTLPPGKLSPDANSYHYLMDARDSFEPFFRRMIFRKAARRDSFTVLQYKTFIDYSSLKYLYITEGQTITPEYDDPQWRKFERGVYISKLDVDVALETSAHYKWIRSWKRDPVMVMGPINKPDELSSLMLVVEVIIPDQREMLAGPDRDIDVQLYFNRQQIKIANRRYEGNPLFGESYKYYFTIDKELFSDSNFFMFKMVALDPIEIYAIDVYDFALKD